MNLHVTKQASQFVHVQSPLISCSLSYFLKTFSNSVIHAVLFPLSKPDNLEFFFYENKGSTDSFSSLALPVPFWKPNQSTCSAFSSWSVQHGQWLPELCSKCREANSLILGYFQCLGLYLDYVNSLTWHGVDLGNSGWESNGKKETVKVWRVLVLVDSGWFCVRWLIPLACLPPCCYPVRYPHSSKRTPRTVISPILNDPPPHSFLLPLCSLSRERGCEMKLLPLTIYRALRKSHAVIRITGKLPWED